MAFKKINFDDVKISLFQDNVSDALEGNTTQLQKTIQNGQTIFVRTQVSQPFFGGNLVITSLVNGVDNLVAHGLDRIPTVWTLMRLDANTNVWEVTTSALATPSQPTRSASDTYLNLWSGSVCNITLWIN